MSTISKLRVAARRGTLTRELADGVAPESSPELTLRAAQLTSLRTRRQLARTYERTLGEARRRRPVHRFVTPNRIAVLESEEAITALIEQLRGPDPVTPQGMAMAERVITAGDWSPLWDRAEPGVLRRTVLLTNVALEPVAAAEPELALAA